MLLAKVTGTVVSTIKHPSHHGRKLLMVQPIGLDGGAVGTRHIAVDAADAGVGDTVLVNNDGGAAIMILEDKRAIIDMTICGVIDHVDVE